MMRSLKVVLVALVALLTLVGGLFLGAVMIVVGLMATAWRRWTGASPRPPMNRPPVDRSRRTIKRVAPDEVTVRDVGPTSPPELVIEAEAVEPHGTTSAETPPPVR